MNEPRIRCRKGGTEHIHHSVAESRDCWGTQDRATASAALTSATAKYTQVYTPPAAQPAPVPVAIQYSGSRAYNGGEKILKFLPMLDTVQDGYYAVQPDTDTPLTFLRVSRPSRADSKLKGCTVLQRVSGPDLDRGLVIHPPSEWAPESGHRCQVYDQRVEDAVLLLICDPMGSARRYATEIGKCARCNLRLTDARSRHYGIGPECEKHWPWMIVQVDEQESFEL